MIIVLLYLSKASNKYSVLFEIKMGKLKNIGWLTKAIVESVFILMGIFAAFALENWKDDQEIKKLIILSINNFENEIKQNNSRISDVIIYHKGVQQILQNRDSKGNINSIKEFLNIMQAMQPIALTNSAWDTAVATGVFTRMDFELVSALTLTYNAQDRFEDNYRTELKVLLSPSNLNSKNLEAIVYNASQFILTVTAQESELTAYYDQALIMLRAHLLNKS